MKEKTYPRQMVRIRTSGQLNAAASRSAEVITTVPADKVLVIETGSAFPPGTGSPLIDIPVTRMATDPAGNFVNHVALAHMRAYATDGLVQYSIDLSAPSSGDFDLSLFGYLLSADSPSFAP